MVTKVKTIDEITAVIKFAISNPGTTNATAQRRTTFIRKAVIPNVIIEIGKNIICKTGLIKVLTTPITTAVTTVAQKLSNLNPGTRYATTSKVNTLSVILRISLVII
jgi:hypothetical protein